MDKPGIGKTVALLAGIGIGGALLFGGGSAKASTPPIDTSGASTKGAIDGCAAGKADAIAKKPQVLNPSADPKVTAQATASGNSAAYLAAYTSNYASCYVANVPKGGGGGGGGSSTYDPKKATNPSLAHSLAAAIGDSPVPPNDGTRPASLGIASDGTYASIKDFATWPTSNHFSVSQFQQAAGLGSSSGGPETVGPLTTAAFNYWVSHTDASGSVAGEGGTMDTTRWGNQVVAAIAGESDIQKLGTLMLQARAFGLSDVEAKIATRIAGCCSSCDNGGPCAPETVGVYGSGGFGSGGVYGRGGRFGFRNPLLFGATA